MELYEKKLFLLDMDGTLYLGNKLFDGTIDFLNLLKNAGKKYLFLTNNSSKSTDKYIKKLAGMGIKSSKEEFTTSAQATAMYLKNHHKDDLIYVFGTQSFRKELENIGLNVTDKLVDDIKCLTLGFDTELSFHKLEDACTLLVNGVDYIASNCDLVCPTEYGYVPDCGSISQILFNATKRKPKFIGKPEPYMIDLALSKTGYKKEEAVILGDRVYTDIKCGNNCGIDTIFMLSGESTIEDLKKNDIESKYIYNNIQELYIYLKSNIYNN